MTDGARNNPDDTIEQPKETCGLMLTLEGGIGVKVNLKHTREEVIKKIQDHLTSKEADLPTFGLIQFNTLNPDKEEVCLFDPKKVLLVLVTKEFLFSSGKIIQASVIEDPDKLFRH